MTTTTCAVCGASEDPGPDRTCPACGADLPPEPTAPATPSGDDAASGDDVASDPDTSAPGPTPPAGVAPGAATPSPPPPPPPAPGGGWSGGPAPRPSPHDPSHPSGLSDSLRTYGMFTHLSSFAAFVGLPILGPLVLWLVRRDEHPFLDHHGKEALNFNLSLLLYGVVGFVVTIVTVFVGLIVVLPASLALTVLWIVTTIQAAVAANRGQGYRYPITIRFIAD